ncbi:Cu(I)-responsive transcriptional regulator [Sphingosinicella sp. CPCC 101087]|uniref:Cu(I)-responsive transcriptional regulator n=1 Tax=Sphingosinicella sp. CPCC 101087 TaxID=2497754 RepID=UPI00101C758F|nr:Cu(I)-responsive transcriptional regulator [Sphingosinicella sp. CPCC 101087]
MNIGEASRRSGLPAKTIRYYEQIGLMTPARRDNDYRDYAERDVHELRFVARARALGFSIEECRRLLALYRDRTRSSADVREAAERHLAQIRSKIAELREMERTLNRLIDACHGDDKPDCPILDGLASE